MRRLSTTRRRRHRRRSRTSPGQFVSSACSACAPTPTRPSHFQILRISPSDPAALPLLLLHCMCSSLPMRRTTLRGTTPAGTGDCGADACAIHQLAAGKVLLELKDGMSYVHSVVGDIDEERRSELLGEWVRKEGINKGWIEIWGCESVDEFYGWPSFPSLQRLKTAAIIGVKPTLCSHPSPGVRTTTTTTASC